MRQQTSTAPAIAPPLTIVRPTKKPKKDPLWEGIHDHNDGASWRAVVSQGRKQKPLKRIFPRSTDPHVMQEWRTLVSAKNIVEREAKATQGAFVLDAEKYLDLEEVRRMPTYAQRRLHIYVWVDIFGKKQRSEITKNEIANAYLRMQRVPRRVPVFADPRRNANRKTDTRPIAIATANKILRALSHMYWMLDGKRDHIVRKVKELQPEQTLIDLTDDGLESSGRSIPYAEVEQIIAGMEDIGRGGRFDREDFSATKIRLRCMAYCQITSEALMALDRSKNHINFKHQCVALKQRGKGKGAPPIWTPVTTKAMAAFKEFHERNLYGSFGRSPMLRSWKRAVERAGLSRPQGYRVYDLRHTVATALKRVSSDREAIDYLLQHKIQGTTLVYTVNSMPDRVRAAVAALDAHQRSV